MDHATTLSVSVGDATTARSRQHTVLSAAASGGTGSGTSRTVKLSAKEQAAAEEAKAKLERMVKVGKNPVVWTLNSSVGPVEEPN